MLSSVSYIKGTSIPQHFQPIRLKYSEHDYTSILPSACHVYTLRYTPNCVYICRNNALIELVPMTRAEQPTSFSLVRCHIQDEKNTSILSSVWHVHAIIVKTHSDHKHISMLKYIEGTKIPQ